MEEITLFAKVPKNRNLSGWMEVRKNGVSVKRIPVLARGNRGPGDTQFLNQGNTPTGLYDGSVFVGSQNLDPKKYGHWGAIRLKPLEGNALLAEQIFGRSGLLIHSGTLGGPRYWRGQNELRATQGCLRVHDQDMRFLQSLLFEDSTRKMTRLKPFKVNVIVSE